MPSEPSTAAQAILAVAQRRAVTLSSGSVIGAVVYLQTDHVRDALIACVLGPPAVAGGKILAEWVRLLSPPRRWRRPRRRGG
jgi:hypothetical protein